MSEVVLDASAVLAFLTREPGLEAVRQALPTSALSAVNLTEVVTRLLDLGFPPNEVRGHVERLFMDVVSLDEDLAMDAGFLREVTRGRRLSLGDRACLALARQRGVPVLTADRNWQHIDVGVEIRLIRD